MCQRKIIGKGYFKVVPVMNGCDCPMVTQIRDIDHPKVRHFLRTCVDAKTQLVWNNGNPVEWRFCICNEIVCRTLPSFGPISDPVYNEQTTTFIDIEDWEDEHLDGGSLGFV